MLFYIISTKAVVIALESQALSFRIEVSILRYECILCFYCNGFIFIDRSSSKSLDERRRRCCKQIQYTG